MAGLLQYALTGRVEGELAKDIAEAVEVKNLDRKWVKASMGIMTYEHEFQVLNHELEKKRLQVEAATVQLEAATEQLEAASEQLETATEQLEATSAQLEATSAQLEATSAQLEATSAQLESASAEADAAQAVQRLSRKLYEAGRGDEYFAALDDPTRMNELLAEFGEA